MKITKKTPLRPRGRSEAKRESTKSAIRDAFANGPSREVQIIPARRDLETDEPKRKLRVCAYCRVSTDESDQKNSLTSQKMFFSRYFEKRSNWNNVGIFADENAARAVRDEIAQTGTAAFVCRPVNRIEA